MREEVNEWRQEGRIFIWRYARPNRSWRGWHFTGDPRGCQSFRNLLDRMCGSESCHRTLDLAPVTNEILKVPSFGRKAKGRFDKLRVEFDPDAQVLALEPNGSKLTMTVGNKRLRCLTAALADVETGQGDFGIATNDERKSDPWMFWWMPRSYR